jgi:hypothetical protein
MSPFTQDAVAGFDSPESEIPIAARRVLAYLDTRLPGYPFNPNIDRPFVEELLEDFPSIDILEEIKAWRWYHDNGPTSSTGNPRLALRRWISNSFKR